MANVENKTKILNFVENKKLQDMRGLKQHIRRHNYDVRFHEIQRGWKMTIRSLNKRHPLLRLQ